MDESAPLPADFLIYDGDCPICQRYVAMTALRRAHPGIELLDARKHPGLVSTLRQEGIEINDTYMLQLGDERLTGAAAMARISFLMKPQTPIEQIIRRLTRSERILKPVYPWLVRVRKALLWLSGRDQIH